MRLISETALAVITIWQEARGEVFEGKIAVGEVIRNRMKKKYSSDGSVAGTVLKAYQFSGWNTGDANRIPSLKLDDSEKTVKECVDAWNRSGSTNLAAGALLYYAKSIPPPPWAKDCVNVADVGNHIFFVPR
jgi:N-acetylmuramoyl-L-alanine amidase